MLHNAHVYFASKLFKSKDHLLIIGSFLPDIAVTGIIGWEGGLHGNKETSKFFNFIQKNYPTYINLFKGVLAHNILDEYTHYSYKKGFGYAYQDNEDLVKLVKKYYSLNEKEASVTSHNYIETGVDILLLNKNTNISEKINRVVEQVDKKELSILLSTYFKIDQSKFYEAIFQFFDLFTKYDLTETGSWSNLWRDLEAMLSLKIIDEKKRNQLINMSIDIVESTYEDFLSYSLIEGSKKIKNAWGTRSLARLINKL